MGTFLTTQQKQSLLALSHSYLQSFFRKTKILEVQSELYEIYTGAFVSLYIKNKLRGCIGQFNSDTNLPELIGEMTYAAAFNDRRFKPIKDKELEAVKIEISVLTPMHKIQNIDEIELGKHGIYIKYGDHGGTFLPQVATSTGWTLEEFLGHCSRDKANLGWGGWRSAEIFTYEAIVFHD